VLLLSNREIFIGIMRFSTVKTALILATVVTTVSPQQQQPLTRPSTRTGDNFHVKEQPAALYDAGSRHYTGTVNITAEKSVFFCEFNILRDGPSAN
jgi:hypothetical protein